MHEIALIVARHFNVWHEAMRHKTRRRDITKARQISMYLLKKHTTKSAVQIGEMFNRDHATVLHAIKTVQKDMETNIVYRENVMQITYKINTVYTPTTQKFCNPVKFKFYVSNR